MLTMHYHMNCVFIFSAKRGPAKFKQVSGDSKKPSATNAREGDDTVGLERGDFSSLPLQDKQGPQLHPANIYIHPSENRVPQKSASYDQSPKPEGAELIKKFLSRG